MRSTRTVRRECSRRGSALIASVIVVLLLSVMGAALVQVQSARTRRQMQSVDNVRALYVAEAGLSEAFLAVSEGKSGMIASEAQPASFGDGIYWVEAADHPDGQVLLKSNGLCGIGRFSLAIVVQRESNPIAQLGFFGEDGVEIRSGAVVDGFDARLGPFSEQLNPNLPIDSTGSFARVASNGEVAVLAEIPLVSGGLKGRTIPISPSSSPATTIYGDAVPGPQASVILDPLAVVTGSTTPAIQSTSLPEVTVPELPLQAMDPLGTISGSAQYQAIVVATGRELRIAGPATIAVSDLTVERGATLHFDTSGGAITLYCTNMLSLAEGSTLANTATDAGACAILITGSDDVDRNGDSQPDPAVTIRSGGVYYGQIFAPDACLSLPNTLRMYGSVAGRSLVIEAGARLSFDTSLAFTESSIPGLPSLISWHVADLPNSELFAVGTDPMELLQVNGIVPIPSADAHCERTCRLTYVDANGVVQTVTAAPKDIDWSNMAQIVNLTWYDKLGRVVTTYEWVRKPISEGIQTTYDADSVNNIPRNNLFPVKTVGVR